MSSFFDYPEPTEGARHDELVFLPAWTEEDWHEFSSHCQVRRYRPGEVVVSAGESERAIYIITNGVFEVLLPYSRPGRREVPIYETGSVIGEIGFFDGKPRTATVRSLTEGETLRLPFEAFEIFAAHDQVLARQVLADLGRLLAIKLRSAESMLTS